MATKSTWKTVERRVARQLGGRRIGPGVDRADVRAGAGDWLCIEVKHRSVIPAWIKDGHSQARRYAGENQLPIEVIHEHGSHDSYVVMSLKDFQSWFGELPGQDAGERAQE